MANMILDTNTPKVARKPRRPQHPFYIKSQPFAIVPFMIAPVLPGETVSNILLQSRCVTKPVKNPVIGWWKEYYFFYCKHTDLAGSETFKNMMLDLETDITGQQAGTANDIYYRGEASAGINWLAQCYTAIVDQYFRDDGEDTTTNTVDNYAAAKVNNDSWLDSYFVTSTLETGGDLGDITAAAEDVTMAALDKAWTTWQFLQAQELTNQTYEEWLRAQGIRGVLAADDKKPELLRYIRDWTYPSNTVEPTTGVPASALSWAITERADKDRFISEPGFIVGITVTRPKVYRAKQKGGAYQYLDNALLWLPQSLAGNPETSLREFDEADGPLNGNQTANYTVDMRDLFMHGDQHANFDLDADATGVAIDLPTAAGNHKYPTEAMVDTLFVSGDAAGGIYEDGVVTLNILSRQRDHT